MFRRQTDQVYEMLQNVQRQMTNQDEGGSAWSSRSGTKGARTSDGQQFWRNPVPESASPFAAGTGPLESTAEPQPPEHDDLPPPATVTTMQVQRVPMSLPLLSVLMLLWILTLFVAYYIGRRHQVQALQQPAVGLAAGAAGHREIPVDTNAGPDDDHSNGSAPARPSTGPSDVLILKSVLQSDDDTRTRWQKEADSLNQLASSRGADQLPPLFGVREPSSGGLQLVYGYRDGRFGIDRERFKRQAAALRQAKYQTARWIRIE